MLQVLSLFKKLELGDVTREMSVSEDFLATIKDANVKEIIAKESLEYQPSKSDSVLQQRQAVGQLIEANTTVSSLLSFGNSNLEQPEHERNFNK